MQLTRRRLTPLLVALATFAAAPVARGATPLSAIDEKAAAELAVYQDTNAVQVVTSSLRAGVADPLRGWSANGSYLVDFVSGASVDIVSTASSRWSEVRHAGTLAARYKPSRVSVEASGAVSSEPDYRAMSGGLVGSMEVRDKTVTPMLGYAYAHETAGRKGTPFSIYALELARHTISAGVELVLDEMTTLSITANGLFELGDQSKPYRYLPLFAREIAPRIQPGASFAIVNEARLPGRMAERVPDLRQRFALSFRFARRLARTTFVASERLYADDWGLRATTTDLRVIHDLAPRLDLSGRMRGHVQSSVDFWRRAYTADITPGGVVAPSYRTGDRELSSLSTVTAGAGLRWYLTPRTSEPRWSVGLQAEVWFTFFRDALYIRDRWAYLDALDVTVEL
ncbi:MAG: DUF3570 domain-containing protein [Labilithrix sp.]